MSVSLLKKFVFTTALMSASASFADAGSTVVCTGGFLMGTNTSVVIRIQEFGNGTGSCVVQDAFGRVHLSITGRTNGFSQYGGSVYYTTDDNYQGECDFGYVAQGPDAGRLTAGWKIYFGNKIGNLRNGRLVQYCQRSL